jgi:hypothetical protein
MKRMLKKQRKLEQQQQSTQSKNVLQKIWIWIKAVLHFDHIGVLCFFGKVIISIFGKVIITLSV